MIKFSALLLCITLLLACTNNEWVKKNIQDTNHGYFSDASECGQTAIRKEKLLVPTAGSLSVVEIPIYYDANVFIVCMEHAGRPVSRVDLTEYLNVSTACLQKARGTENPDESYADCIKRSRLDVEIITDE